MADFLPENVAFVTGAASGIGLAISQRLLSDGVTKIAIVDFNPSSLSLALSTLSSSFPSAKILSIETDCGKEEDVEKAVEKTVEEFGRIDFCVNAAGISGKSSGIAEMETGEMERVVGTNLLGVWYCERAQIRQMVKQEVRDVSTGLPVKTRGSIVNVGSVLSHSAIVKGLGPYTVSKHGVLGLVRQDAHDYGAQGIRVNCICPGWIKTGINEAYHENSTFEQHVVRRAPMGRWGQPEEVAYLTAFLLSDKASFITGASMTIDGGLSVL